MLGNCGYGCGISNNFYSLIQGNLTQHAEYFNHGEIGVVRLLQWGQCWNDRGKKLQKEMSIFGP